MTAPTKHAGLLAWIDEIARMTQPDSLVWCNGTKAEYDSLIGIMVESGLATPLAKRPNSFLFRSDASDVARVENRTYIASRSKDDAGPTNNWIDPVRAEGHDDEALYRLHEGPYDVRDPFLHGPGGIADRQNRRPDHRFSLCRGQHAHHDPCRAPGCSMFLEDSGEFVPCLHSIGKPLLSCQDDAGPVALRSP